MNITETIDIQLARMRVRYAKTPLPKFFKWWWGELVGLLPGKWRSLFAERSQELLLGGRARELDLWRWANERCSEYGSISLDAPVEDQRAEFVRLRDQIDDPNLRIIYCIPAQSSLRRSLTLPGAAEDKLRHVLAFEMDRQTPFKADQVYFDYKITERDAVAKNLKVDLTVVPRTQLDSQLAALTACGIQLDGVDCWTGAVGSSRAGLNLLAAERRIKRKNQRLRLNFALGATALVLLIAAMWLSVANREASLEAMQAEVQKASNDAKQTMALEKKLEDNMGSANYLFRLKRDSTTMTEMLADLTRRLPDDTFLERLSVDEKGKIELTGQSGNANKLGELLQKSSVVIKPNFTGTIQTDAKTKKDRFTLTVELAKRPDADASKKDVKQTADDGDKRAGAKHAPAT